MNGEIRVHRGLSWPCGLAYCILERWSHKEICGVHIKRECLARECVELRTQYFDFANLFLVPLTLFATKGSLWKQTDGKNKTYLYFVSIQPENIFI